MITETPDSFDDDTFTAQAVEYYDLKEMIRSLEKDANALKESMKKDLLDAKLEKVDTGLPIVTNTPGTSSTLSKEKLMEVGGVSAGVIAMCTDTTPKTTFKVSIPKERKGGA